MIPFVIVLLILAFIAQNWSIKNAFKGIGYSCESSKLLVEPDEVFDLITTVTNHSKRFIPFIKLEQPLPKAADIQCPSAKTSEDFDGNLKHIHSTYLRRNSIYEKRLPISLQKRGCHYFKSAQLISGDFLGISPKMRHVYTVSSVVVCPKPARTKNFDSVMGGFLGDISVRRFIMEDPILTIGARQYTGKEPLKQISWKHTARQNRLMVKQFDYTVEPNVSVMLDVNTQCVGGDRRELLENCYCLTRSVCELLEQKGIRYDFITNATTGNAISSWAYIAEGLGKAHLFTILEGLGRASYLVREPFVETIGKLQQKRYISRGVVIITPERGDEKQQHAEKLCGSGFGAAALLYGEDI